MQKTFHTFFSYKAPMVASVRQQLPLLRGSSRCLYEHLQQHKFSSAWWWPLSASIFSFSPTLSTSRVVRVYKPNCIKNVIKAALLLGSEGHGHYSILLLLKFPRTLLHLSSTASIHSWHGSPNTVSNLYEYFNLMRPGSFSEGRLSLSAGRDHSTLNGQILKANCS